MLLSRVLAASALLLAATHGYQPPGGIASPASFRRSFGLSGRQASYQPAYPPRFQSPYQSPYQPQYPYTRYVYQGGQGYRSPPATYTSPTRYWGAAVPWASSYSAGALTPTAVWASSYSAGAMAPSSHWASVGAQASRGYYAAPWRTSMNGYAAPFFVMSVPTTPPTTTTTTTTTTATPTTAPPTVPPTAPPTAPPTPAPMVLPPGVTLPPGVVIPPGFTFPPGFTLPPGGIPPNFVMPPGGLTSLFGSGG